MSPYRMNPAYFRPRPLGGDSSGDDHGYSTMTPVSEVPAATGVTTGPEEDSYCTEEDMLVPDSVKICSPYRMNPGYLRPAKAAGTSSSVAGAAPSTLAGNPGSDFNMSKSETEIDDLKHHSLDQEVPNQILVSATVHQSSD